MFAKNASGVGCALHTACTLSTSMRMQTLRFKFSWKSEQGLWQEGFVLEVTCQDISLCYFSQKVWSSTHKYHDAHMSEEALK